MRNHLRRDWIPAKDAIHRHRLPLRRGLPHECREVRVDRMGDQIIWLWRTLFADHSLLVNRSRNRLVDAPKKEIAGRLLMCNHDPKSTLGRSERRPCTKPNVRPWNVFTAR